MVYNFQESQCVTLCIPHFRIPRKGQSNREMVLLTCGSITCPNVNKAAVSRRRQAVTVQRLRLELTVLPQLKRRKTYTKSNQINKGLHRMKAILNRKTKLIKKLIGNQRNENVMIVTTESQTQRAKTAARLRSIKSTSEAQKNESHDRSRKIKSTTTSRTSTRHTRARETRQVTRRNPVLGPH